MTFNFDLHPAHALSNIKNVYVDSLCVSVVTENWHGLASVTIISAGWTGHFVLIARNSRECLIIFTWGR